MLDFWIASYPRSGNTLVRISISQALLPPGEQDFVDRNFPSIYVEQSVADQRSNKPIPSHITETLPPDVGMAFTGRYGSVRFTKIHWRSPEIMDLFDSLGGIYLLRHPVDIFLSGLNYMYINAGREDVFRKYFLDATPRGVSDICTRGEIKYYLDDFCYNLGFWPFEFSSGTWTDNVRNWLSASPDRNVRPISYKHFVNARGEELLRIFQAAGLTATSDQITQGIRGGEEATKPDGQFFWRGGDSIKHQYVSQDMIEQITRSLIVDTGLESMLRSWLA